MKHRPQSKLVVLLATVVAAALASACGPEAESTDTGVEDNQGAAGALNEPASGTPATADARGCNPSNTTFAPADGLIANFQDPDGGVLQGGELVAFAVGSAAAPTFTTQGGALGITLNAPATSLPQVPNVLLAFDGCLDASAFNGVQFSISGSFSGCTMQYASGDVAHQDANSGAPLATGPEGAFQPLTSIEPTELAATPLTLTIPFVGGSGLCNPATPLDKATLIFLLWQCVIPPAPGGGATPCVGDITIDDVSFY